MLQVFQVESIRDAMLEGKSIAEIARVMKIDYKTAKKYVEQDDFNEPELPVCIKRGSILDPYKAEIRAMYEECLGWNRKQRYTAKRIWILLGQRHQDFPCSYNLVARFMKAYKQQLRDCQRLGFEELVWHPGEAQVDFGHADFLVNGRLQELCYLVITFPASNKAMVQLFSGENAECVCQGLRDVFEHIGGSFTLAVFDNSTGVGRRMGEVVRESRLFSRFRMHYGFAIRFCNTYSGHEKGSVEENVGFIRRNLFVPPLSIPNGDIAAFNRTQMLEMSDGLRKGELHYKHGVLVDDLFEADRRALRPLPGKPFEVFTRQTVKSDGYGRVCLDRSHYYTLGAAFSHRAIIVDLTAWEVRAYTAEGRTICTFGREYGEERTSSVNMDALVASLARKPGSWPNSIVRETMDDCPLKRMLDDPATTRKQASEVVRMWGRLSETYPYDIARMALDECLRRGQPARREDAVAVANRIMTFAIGASENVTGVDLGKYNVLLPVQVQEVPHA